MNSPASEGGASGLDHLAQKTGRYPLTQEMRRTISMASVLHDIGKFLEYDIKDGKACHSEMGKYYNHVVSGAYIAKSNGLPDKIVHMILEHSDMQSPANTYDYPELMMMKKLDHMCFSIAWMAYPCK